MNSLFCFACMRGFCFTCSTVSISIHEFPHFYSFDSLPYPTVGGHSVSSCVRLSCQLRLNHHTIRHKKKKHCGCSLSHTDCGLVSTNLFRLPTLLQCSENQILQAPRKFLALKLRMSLCQSEVNASSFLGY